MRSQAERFWSRVRRTPTCWHWTGTRTNGGYGRVYVGPRRVMAHRWIWERTVGPTPDGFYVLHRCDNRQCVRPAHLSLGTLVENNADRDRKGRHVPHHHNRGERHGMAVLTEQDVLAIRRRLVAGEKERPLATAFGVSRGTINDIRRGKSWRHLALVNELQGTA